MIIIPDRLDLDFCTTKVAIGGAIYSKDDIADLKRIGITHIINCRSEFNDANLFSKDTMIHYLWAGTDDDSKTKDPFWFKKILDFALPALTLPDTKIFAHCMAGINRGPSAGYAILRAQGFDKNDAMVLIKKVRPIAHVCYADDAEVALEAFGYERYLC